MSYVYVPFATSSVDEPATMILSTAMSVSRWCHGTSHVIVCT